MGEAKNRRWYGGMKPVDRPKYETQPPVDPPPAEKQTLKITQKPKPLQKGTGEESVE